MAEACEKTGFQVHAYCLMGNHCHLVMETPEANLVAGMRWLLSTYTIRLHHRHKLCGHVFSGRTKALLDEAECEPLPRGWCPGSEAFRKEMERRESDPAKLALAARLRWETTLTVGRIAKRLHLGSGKSAAL